MVSLGTLDGHTNSNALATNFDGSVIVGDSGSLGDPHAYRWTQEGGMRPLADILAESGVDLEGWQLAEAVGISGDGAVIVGSAVKNGELVPYIATTGETSGVSTFEELLNSLGEGTVPSAQSLSAVDTGLKQSLFAARQFALLTQPAPQFASADPTVTASPESRRWSTYAVGSFGLRHGNDSGSHDMNGTTGLSVELAPNVRVGAGILGSYGKTELDLDGESRVKALGGSMLAAYEQPEGLRLYASAMLAQLDVETQRNYRNGSGTDGSRGETDGIGYGLALRGGWAFPVAERTNITPYGELEWSRTELDGYEEEGGAFPATFSDHSAEELVSRLGAELSYQWTPALDLQFRGAWAHRLDGDGGRLKATTLGLTRTLSPSQGDDNWAEGAVAARWRVSDATSLSAEIGGRSGKTASARAYGTLGLSISF